MCTKAIRGLYSIDVLDWPTIELTADAFRPNDPLNQFITSQLSRTVRIFRPDRVPIYTALVYISSFKTLTGTDTLGAEEGGEAEPPASRALLLLVPYLVTPAFARLTLVPCDSFFRQSRSLKMS